MPSKRNTRTKDLAAYHFIYMADIARGGSHIASTLSATSQQSAIDEVIRDFCVHNAPDNLHLFLELVAENLERRGAMRAAVMVREKI